MASINLTLVVLGGYAITLAVIGWHVRQTMLLFLLASLATPAGVLAAPPGVPQTLPNERRDLQLVERPECVLELANGRGEVVFCAAPNGRMTSRLRLHREPL